MELRSFALFASNECACSWVYDLQAWKRTWSACIKATTTAAQNRMLPCKDPIPCIYFDRNWWLWGPIRTWSWRRWDTREAARAEAERVRLTGAAEARAIEAVGRRRRRLPQPVAAPRVRPLQPGRHGRGSAIGQRGKIQQIHQNSFRRWQMHGLRAVIPVASQCQETLRNQALRTSR